MKKSNTNTVPCCICGYTAKLYKDEKRIAHCDGCDSDLALCDYCGEWFDIENVELINPAPKGYKCDDVVCINCLGKHGYDIGKNGWERITYKGGK